MGRDSTPCPLFVEIALHVINGGGKYDVNSPGSNHNSAEDKRSDKLPTVSDTYSLDSTVCAR
jgi:hypothetical protein